MHYPFFLQMNDVWNAPAKEPKNFFCKGGGSLNEDKAAIFWDTGKLVLVYAHSLRPVASWHQNNMTSVLCSIALRLEGYSDRYILYHFVINVLVSMGIEIMSMDSKIFEPSDEILVFCNRQA